ncbi:DUF433 domain-containing protein [Microcoleus sp. BR0-C5]|uniref:DUF433 domain-containing protein n=1 Tax=Microcoleus sp. BR0-C5 TaxID=2818713 RepID=UPI002FD213FA
MTLKELEPQRLSLTPPEKAQAIQILAQSLAHTWQGIEKTPGVVGGNARIAGTRISVWGLVESRRLGAMDAQLLEDYPHLSANDLKNAWAYAEVFPDEIEAVINLNDIN